MTFSLDDLIDYLSAIHVYDGFGINFQIVTLFRDNTKRNYCGYLQLVSLIQAKMLFNLYHKRRVLW